MFERTIMSKTKEIYIIDYLQKQILLIKRFDSNKKAKWFITPKSIDKIFNVHE
jgi:hypothetical protein